MLGMIGPSSSFIHQCPDLKNLVNQMPPPTAIQTQMPSLAPALLTNTRYRPNHRIRRLQKIPVAILVIYIIDYVKKIGVGGLARCGTEMVRERNTDEIG